MQSPIPTRSSGRASPATVQAEVQAALSEARAEHEAQLGQLETRLRAEAEQGVADERGNTRQAYVLAATMRGELGAAVRSQKSLATALVRLEGGDAYRGDEVIAARRSAATSPVGMGRSATTSPMATPAESEAAEAAARELASATAAIAKKDETIKGLQQQVHELSQLAKRHEEEAERQRSLAADAQAAVAEANAMASPRNLASRGSIASRSGLGTPQVDERKLSRMSTPSDTPGQPLVVESKPITPEGRGNSRQSRREMELRATQTTPAQTADAATSRLGSPGNYFTPVEGVTLPPGSALVITGVRCWGVPDADEKKGSGHSDPYVRFAVRADGKEPPLAVAQTGVSKEGHSPDWSSEPPLRLELESGARSTAALSMTLTLLDKDFTNEDDPLATFTLNEMRALPGRLGCDVVLRGLDKFPDVRAHFEYEIVAAPPAASPPPRGILEGGEGVSSVGVAAASAFMGGGALKAAARAADALKLEKERNAKATAKAEAAAKEKEEAFAAQLAEQRTQHADESAVLQTRIDKLMAERFLQAKKRKDELERAAALEQDNKELQASEARLRKQTDVLQQQLQATYHQLSEVGGASSKRAGGLAGGHRAPEHEGLSIDQRRSSAASPDNAVAGAVARLASEWVAAWLGRACTAAHSLTRSHFFPHHAGA